MGCSLFDCFLWITFPCLAGLLWCHQESLLFHPAPYGLPRYEADNYPLFRNPGERDMEYSEENIQTVDGEILNAWFMTQRGDARKSAPTILFFQGNAGNKGFRMDLFQELYQHCEVNILAISYRGFGTSTGEPTERGVYRDADAALEFLLKRDDIDTKKIFVFGRSLGGAVAIHLTSEKESQIAGLILENTFTSIKDMLKTLFPGSARLLRLILRLKMSSIDKISKLSLPVMFISGTNDELVPQEHMRKLHDRCNSDLKVFEEVKGGQHEVMYQIGGMAYFDKINSFIRNALFYRETSACSEETSFVEFLRLTS